MLNHGFRVTSSPGYSNWQAYQPQAWLVGDDYAAYSFNNQWRDINSNINVVGAEVYGYLVEYGQGNAPVTTPTPPTVSITQGIRNITGLTENSALAFQSLNIGQSLTVAGLRFTATSTLTSDQVAAAFANLADGSTQGSLNAFGTYSGTLTGFHSGANITNSVTFVSSQTNTNVVDIGLSLGNVVDAPNTPVVQTTQGVSTVPLSLSISDIDAALDAVNNTRATLGSYINRLADAGDNVANISSNAVHSRSTIIDTDYALETTALAKNQIIQSAATAMLAQANQQPQAVMALLKNLRA
jgi:flagellin-like hook-associated protein FlgL